MDYNTKVVLFVYGALDELIDAGLVEGSKMLTESGRIEYAQLLAENFQPTPEELQSTLNVIMSDN